jgi:hypothetical protein
MSEMIDLKKERNFFETRVIEYQSGGALLVSKGLRPMKGVPQVVCERSRFASRDVPTKKRNARFATGFVVLGRPSWADFGQRIAVWR